MTQVRRERPAPPVRVRANDWEPMGGPVLPGEFRPLAPVPAASESGEPPYLPEAELLRQLCRYYRWCRVGPHQLQRSRPMPEHLRVITGGRADG